MTKIKIYLNGKEYTKTKALEIIKEILNKYPLESNLNENDFKTVIDALDYHPNKDEKIGCGVTAIKIVKEEIYGHRRFDLIRKDGSRQDFSYIKSLTASNLHFKDVMHAMRYSILDQVREFKNSLYGNKKYVRCAITGLNIQKKDAHTDHKSPFEFNVLAFNFLKQKQIKIRDVKIENTAFVACVDFSDKILKAEWQHYHKEHAQLQIVLDHANLGQSKAKVCWEEII